MNKGQLVEAVQKKLGKDTSKAAADAALNAVIDCITKAVKKEPVQIIGFGTFSVVKRAARTGINPQTGPKIKIKASKSVKFKLVPKSSRLLSDLSAFYPFIKNPWATTGFFIQYEKRGL